MNFLLFLLFFPLLPALLSLLLPPGRLQGWIVRGSAAVIAAAAIGAAVRFGGAGWVFFEAHSHLVEQILFYGGLGIAAYLLYACRKIRKKETYIPVLVLAQSGIVAWCEASGRLPKVTNGLYVDELSLVMALIIGLVGTLIAVYAVSYMRDYHAHEKEVRDGRRGFFFTVFLFLGGMFGLVFANNLAWLFFAWEITTLCSFLLIGYSRTEEATRNAFRALGLNLVGGLGFAAAILFVTLADGEGHTLGLHELIELGPALALVPALLISFAGLAKSAQMPFSSWLLGAMVAPTPVSALLHSSTMVKAGVFVIIKFAPVFEGTAGGFLIALVGALTFVITSLMAVTQSNAKRVLAYSTIANLGLIVMCAGVGTSETVWAAILLMIFHAVAKALLFLGTGSIEHQIGSRDIEDMEGLVVRRPGLSVLMLIGILGMFLAPFGMLISKYAALRALLDAQGIPGGGAFLALVLAFGSAPTLFFWSKWMGKLVAAPRMETEKGGRLPKDEWLALGALGVFTFFACVLFLPMANFAVDPYVVRQYGITGSLEMDTLLSMIFMMVLLFALPFLYLLIPDKSRYAPGYLAGANVEGSGRFHAAMGKVRTVESRNYYLTTFLKEGALHRWAVGLSTVLLLVLLFFR